MSPFDPQDVFPLVCGCGRDSLGPVGAVSPLACRSPVRAVTDRITPSIIFDLPCSCWVRRLSLTCAFDTCKSVVLTSQGRFFLCRSSVYIFFFCRVPSPSLTVSSCPPLPDLPLLFPSILRRRFCKTFCSKNATLCRAESAQVSEERMRSTSSSVIMSGRSSDSDSPPPHKSEVRHSFSSVT